MIQAKKFNYSYKNVNLGDFKIKILFCNRCNLYLPQKAYHCDDCNICCDNFCFHSILINNCVGRQNLRFYLFYVFINILGYFNITLVFLKGIDPENLEIIYEMFFLAVSSFGLTYFFYNFFYEIYLLGIQSTYYWNLNIPISLQMVFRKFFWINLRSFFFMDKCDNDNTKDTHDDPTLILD